MKDWVDYLLRFLFYIIGKLLILLLVATLLVFSFMAAKDYMNINVLISDGLKERANVVLKSEDSATLSQIFDEKYLVRDDRLLDDTYTEYVVRSYLQDIDIGFKLIMPWQQKVVVKVSETITQIDGELPTDSRTEDMTEEDINPPDWEGATYMVTMERHETAWRITNMEWISEEPLASLAPTE
ncbi:MAG: hypothetical protein AB1Z19_00895 [Eubacteriales bacterium]